MNLGTLHIGTSLFTALKGRLVGRDAEGNRYYEERRPRAGARQRRWVLYANQVEASRVPPEWHAWLHYTTDAPLPEQVPEPPGEQEQAAEGDQVRVHDPGQV